MDKRKDAKRLAKHYFSMLAQAAGERWGSDNAVEVETLVDVIIDAAKDELKAERKNERTKRDPAIF